MKRTLVAVSQDQVESLAGNCYEVYFERNDLQTIHVMCISKKKIVYQKIGIITYFF